ncbi:hypothetical protein EJ08DRAFT_650568 [Tothia fuscella]|uniref:Homeobox domain-containing protein n=1 Tax=Tothia fuscella TaxID=1048955 RepID=A0A9P4TXE2_9PEZI|nr:hypothetical protein EJ08DRAFT_650568 [Tothia fuscella]
MNSPPSSEESENGLEQIQSTSSPIEQLSFVNHSPEQIRDSTAADAENKNNSRQKRRRTSPEDQRILEEEFQRNSKPDKTARMAIVTRVALGEKEVQIWFQNRRQNSRRKSRPLDEHQVLSHLNTTSESHSSTLTGPNEQQLLPNQLRPGAEVMEGLGIGHVAMVEEQASSGLSQDRSEQTVKGKDYVSGKADAQPESQGTTISMTSASSIGVPNSTNPSEIDGASAITASQEAAQSTASLSKGYLANRRSASFIRPQDGLYGLPNPQSVNPRPLRRTGSSVLKLSMTEDGQAKVIDYNALSPSPPRSQTSNILEPAPTRSAGVRRSYSAAGLSDLFGLYDPQKMPRIPGRSRNSQTWAMYCDSDARTSKTLIQTAEQEASGSAGAAITLMRNTSKSALRTNVKKGNTPVLSQNGFSESKKQPRPALKRASTTHGRLQQHSSKSATSGKSKKGEEGDEWERPNTDSDKENWEPEDGQAQAQIPRRRAHASLPSGRRAVLGENANTMSNSSSLGAMMDRQQKQRGSKNAGAEVPIFVEDSPPRSPDMDCVASLLSLSKGAWR